MQAACPRCACQLRSRGLRKPALSPQRWTASYPPSSRFEGAVNIERRAYERIVRTQNDGNYTSANSVRKNDLRSLKNTHQGFVKVSHYGAGRRCLSSTAHSKSRSEQRPDSDDPQTKRRSSASWQRRVTVIGLLATSALTWQASNMFLRDKEKGGAADRAMFKRYTLVGKEPVSSTASIFHLRPTSKRLDPDVFDDWLRQGIVNLEVKQPQIQVVRAYTPLPGMGPESTLRFLIRQEPNGEVSSWLHRLRIDTQLELRGPNYEFAIPNETKNIVFLAGGTGIAPALQAAHSLLEQPRTPNTDSQAPGNGKSIHILWANRRREECVGGVSDLESFTGTTASSWVSRLWRTVAFQTGDTMRSPPKSKDTDSIAAQSQQGLIVRELEALKSRYPGQVSISYFVDEESSFISEASVRQTLQKAIIAPQSPSAPSHPSSTAVQAPSSSAPVTQILVSGPDGFIGALAGPKLWTEGRQVQGPVQGMVRKVLLEEQRTGVDVGSVGVYKI